MGLTRVAGVDHDLTIDVNALLGWAQANGQGVLAAGVMAAYGQIASRWSAEFMEESTIPEIYGAFNSPATDDSLHAVFLSTLRIGSESEPIGADLLSRWYERNIRIAANVVHLAEPGDRILVLFGANHRKLLIDFLRDVPGFEVVEASNYLGH